MENYFDLVLRIEENLAPYAKKSIENESPVFINGKEIAQHYQDIWKTPDGSRKLDNRTPLQLERDRILYSSFLRKQTEKYHVLYSGNRRIVRNYTTHTMRVAHVVRSICKALGLNSDFAEGIALGSKVGAGPFVHVSKKIVDNWLKKKLNDLSETDSLRNSGNKPEQTKLMGGSGDLPAWFNHLKSENVRKLASSYVPLARGENDNLDYSYNSGQESYWLLCTEPFLRIPKRADYLPETMYGIWRHNRNDRHKENGFYHDHSFPESVVGTNLPRHRLDWKHVTFEGLVVQYADDITWIIENLNDANDAAVMGESTQSLYRQLLDSIGFSLPQELKNPLNDSDPGGLYTFFITDFVLHSRAILANEDKILRDELAKGNQSVKIGLSPLALKILDGMAEFLKGNVFDFESRIRNRNRMLESISEVSLDLLYSENGGTLERILNDRVVLESWSADKRTRSKMLLSDEVHRAQLAVDVFVQFGDQELFEFVGIQSF